MLTVTSKKTIESYKEAIAYLSNKVAILEATTTEKVVERTRISTEVYEALASKLMKPSCPKTELEAAYNLGVQAVLEQIRQGWVV